MKLQRTEIDKNRAYLCPALLVLAAETGCCWYCGNDDGLNVGCKNGPAICGRWNKIIKYLNQNCRDRPKKANIAWTKLLKYNKTDTFEPPKLESNKQKNSYHHVTIHRGIDAGRLPGRMGNNTTHKVRVNCHGWSGHLGVSGHRRCGSRADSGKERGNLGSNVAGNVRRSRTKLGRCIKHKWLRNVVHGRRSNLQDASIRQDSLLYLFKATLNWVWPNVFFTITSVFKWRIKIINLKEL